MLITIDSHVHIYDCFDLSFFFQSAFDNFKYHAQVIGRGKSYLPVICMTEGRGDNWFHRLLQCTGSDNGIMNVSIDTMTILRTKEPYSLIIEKDDGETLFVIAGRQIITAERLEVLAIGTEGTFADGETLTRTVQSVLESNAIPVIPWGFGKWYGRRGLILKKFLETGSDRQLFLGDNSGRPAFLPYPDHFRIAANEGIGILSGSDPLPFPSESWRPGSFGFGVYGELDSQRPAESMKKIIFHPETRIIPFGRLEKCMRFLRNQCAMQLKKSKTMSARAGER